MHALPRDTGRGAHVHGIVHALGAQSREAFRPRDGYGLFGIVQGSVYPELREASARALLRIGFDGYAVGGLAIGEGQATTFAVLDATVPHLPADAPRYLMGVGTPDDIIGAVQRGIDMFDCVIPTRAGRTARAYTSRGVFNLRNARFADDARRWMTCACPACTRHSRAYLHHLFKAEEMLGPMLLTWHNVQYYQDLMRGLRTAITERRLDAFATPSAPAGRRRSRHDQRELCRPDPARPPRRATRQPDAAKLERVPNPSRGKHYVVRFTCPEFTSLCPITGQPTSPISSSTTSRATGSWRASR